MSLKEVTLRSVSWCVAHGGPQEMQSVLVMTAREHKKC